VIPLPVILVEFLIAFGLALFGANAVAMVRLRREGNWPPRADAGPAPSRPRIVTGLVLGLLVTLWALASWFGNGYHF
jgi:hypothetical protein